MKEVELLVVGGGPASLSAAISAAERGVQVLLVDENAEPGGQLFKQIHKFFGSAEHRAGVRGFDIGRELLEQSRRAGAEVWLNTVAWGLFEDGLVGLVREDKGVRVKAQRVILAGGAMESTLAFPGWTLPGVVGAGAAQTLVNLHRVLPGTNGLMVGSGNVGLIVGYQLVQAGARLCCVVEAARKIGGYGVHASKLVRAGVPIHTGTTIARAEGVRRVEAAVTVKVDENWEPIPGTEARYAVDFICVAVGLTPLTELAALAGCELAYVAELGGHVPLHDENMETTVPGIYVAGDMTGIDEAHTAMEEGRLAGIAAAESLGRGSPEEAEAEKRAIWARLEALRQGPFGEAVRRGVRRVIKEKERSSGA